MSSRSRSGEENRQRAWTLPLDQIDVSDGYLFRDDSIGEYFARLRRDDPVHFCQSSRFGPFWSVTRFKDIKEVELNHRVFSSEERLGGVTLFSTRATTPRPSFLSMDPPRHDEQRGTVSPITAPRALQRLEGLIRDRVVEIIDTLPINREFDWVPLVSVELTTRMLATLFDFPFEERSRLTWWSDIATGHPADDGPVTSREMQEAELLECANYFRRLWERRLDSPPGNDLLSMMAHSPSTRDLPPEEFIGNILLLIIGGNDTTRNSISGGLLALHENPAQYDRLRANPKLVDSMVPEVIRWQTPIAHMTRTAVTDYRIGGKTIPAGHRVALWYLSANRDEAAIERPEQFIVDRKNPRQHLSFGFGIHHCMGSRLAEMQLRILWEELLLRHPRIVVTGAPRRTLSNFVHGYTSLPVTIPA